ncbi:hypothetical protein KDW_33790 [Dictyobacter vulcani]|uniref:Uncharacterized protein n=1 Tax=Dictyobacter vulcani TaxID=2607529 RepID=A0A5J4KS43_9CHLR|nr:hypothetical protein [Dictyobacter vulcani]GER89217.1 hypothetical protein KDW_33790 [Dictyobacter vulcani]
MVPEPYHLSGQSRLMKHRQRRHPVLQRHPVLASLALIASACLLAIIGYQADTLFPLLTFIGASPALPCLLLACVLGTCGILASIINIIERVEQQGVYVIVCPELKEHTYDRN